MLDELLAQYWDAAYAEGKEGRDHDTEVRGARLLRIPPEGHTLPCCYVPLRSAT
mgnify:CR=1 FL=1